MIGKGAPTRAGTEKAHGEPLGEAEVAATRAALGWTMRRSRFRNRSTPPGTHAPAGRSARACGTRCFDAYRKRSTPRDAAEFERRMHGDLPRRLRGGRQRAPSRRRSPRRETVATRKASQLALEALTPALPELLGGSADLTGSNLTKTGASQTAAHRRGAQSGRHINYGVREFGMSAIANGIALHGGYIPFVGTFLVFSDYARNAVRMAALMKQRVIFVFTHDSIGLGEDGPTHQAVEHAASLRLIPNMDVWRPCDTVETLVAWAAALERRDGPTSLLLSRQTVPFVGRRTRSRGRDRARRLRLARGRRAGCARRAPC